MSPPAATPSQTTKQSASPDRPLLNRAAAFGEIVSLLMRSPSYQALALRELRWLILPPLKHGQLALAEARSGTGNAVIPIGAILWAAVSPDVIQRLTRSGDATPRLEPGDWQSGSTILITTAVGHPRALQPILTKLRDNDWAGRRVLHWTKEPNGPLVISDLDLDSLTAEAAADGSAGARASSTSAA